MKYEKRNIEGDNLPSQSMLFQPAKNIRNNWFESVIFDEIKPNNDKNEEPKNNKDNKILKGLEDILLCCICQDYLENPMNDPQSCIHYACKDCLMSYFDKKKSNAVPCPMCRRIIRKKNLIKIPLFESLRDILEEAKKYQNTEENENFQENCDKHSKNKIFSICLDCKKKMCPICFDERGKHVKHHEVNYERYVQLFKFLRENFADIKQDIIEKENNIKEYKELIIQLEQQKTSYLNLLNDISNKIQSIYSKNQENITQIIASSMKSIADLRNFMTNIKVHISSQYKVGYNDIENFESIKEEIKKRINRLKLKIGKINKNELLNMKKEANKQLLGIKTISYTFPIDKKFFIDNKQVSSDLEKNNDYVFGMELQEDTKTVVLYLDIKKIINNKPNDSSYSAYIEYGNKKKLYLEQHEMNKDLYSYETSLSIDDLFNEKDKKININLTLSSLSLVN